MIDCRRRQKHDHSNYPKRKIIKIVITNFKGGNSTKETFFSTPLKSEIPIVEIAVENVDVEVIKE